MYKFCIRYYQGNTRISPEKYQRIYISPHMGETESNQCMDLIRYQLFSNWRFPDDGISHFDAVTYRTFIEIEIYNLRVFFKLTGNSCDVFETES